MNREELLALRRRADKIEASRKPARVWNGPPSEIDMNHEREKLHNRLSRTLKANGGRSDPKRTDESLNRMAKELERKFHLG